MNIQNLQSYQKNQIRNIQCNKEGAANGKDFAYGILNLEKSPAADMVEFSGNIKPAGNEKPSLGKKLAVGAASALMPGLGQAINGQWGKAAGFFLAPSLMALGLFAMGPAVLPLAIAGTAISNLVGCIDAAKNAKPN